MEAPPQISFAPQTTGSGNAGGDVPWRIRSLLTAALQAEREAHGAERREAFRTTRYLLAGCRSTGIPMAQLAELMGVQPESLRTRSTTDGLIPAQQFTLLAALPADATTRWEQNGILPAATVDERGQISYPASALIAALLHEHSASN